MKKAAVKKLAAALLFASLLAMPFQSVTLAAPCGTPGNNCPYFKTYGGDVMSGGWVKSGNACSTATTSSYQDQHYPNASPDARNGGILAYTKASSGKSAGGASSQYGVFSLGTVDDNSAAAGYGFYSDGALAVSSGSGTVAVNKLSFANGSTWGGLFEGSIRQSSCTPDYYSQKPNLASALATKLAGAIPPAKGGTFDSLSFATCTPNVYCLTQAAVTIKAGTRLTIYVSGNVYIGDNITYEAHDPSNVPKFALVVRGSIYIAPSVTQLDGFYVAQPNPADPTPVTSDTGIIWSCHPNVTGQVNYSTFVPTCTNPLVVNGAFVAKQVMFIRVKGDIGGASTSEDSLSTVAACMPPAASCNVAEIINYSPDLIMGGGFFSSSSSSGSPGGLQIDSMISLPPVF